MRRASLLAVVVVAAAVAARGEQLHAVFLFDRGAVKSASLDALSADELKTVRAAWLWSDERTPARVTGDELRAGTVPKAPAAGKRLAIRVDARPAVRSSGAVIAAPLRMWSEVPEPLLPVWRTDASGIAAAPTAPDVRWRVRFRAPGSGTWWTNVRGTAATLRPIGAKAMNVVVTDEKGKPLPDAVVTIRQTSDGRSEPLLLAILRSDEHGTITLDAIPDVEPVALVAAHEGFAPASVAGRIPDLAPALALDRGITLGGRFVDAAAKPIAGVQIRAAAWIGANTAALFERSATAAADGTWSIEHLPKGRIALTAHKDGYGDYHADERLDRASILGTITLERGLSARIRAVDDLRRPVSGATVASGATRLGTTDKNGVLVINSLGQSTVRINVTRPAYTMATATLEPPFPRETLVTLPRAFHLHASVVDDNATPLSGGVLKVASGDSETVRRFVDGTLDFDVQPDQPLRLTVSAANCQPAEIAVDAGRAGETRQLPDIVLQRGLVVTGRVVSTIDGRGVAGARIWVPRRARQGSIYAWAHGDVAETRSDADGAFELSGIPEQPAVLRVDAPGHARAYVSISPQASPTTDAGTIAVDPGTTVAVTAAAGNDGAVARVDMRGEWLDYDMISAPLHDHGATIRHVPPGHAIVSVVDGGTLLCQRELDVGSTPATVDCGDRALHVTGIVTAGAAVARGGMLIWSAPSAPDVQSVVTTRIGAGGARQASAIGIGRPPIVAEVDEQGRFATDALQPGAWMVSWLPPAGGASAGKAVAIPDVEQYDVALSFAGGRIAGVVVDSSGAPVANAVVRDLDLKSVVRTGPDGAYAFVGMPSGPHRLLAQQGPRYSDETDVTLRDGEDLPPLTITVHEGHRIDVAVSANGAPAPGALVFVQTDDAQGMMTIASSDAAGVAHVDAPGAWQHARAAAFNAGRWSFGEWRARDDVVASGIALPFGDTGDLAVESDKAIPPLRITRDGWDVATLLSRVGLRRDPAAKEILVTGLPPGLYDVVAGGAMLEASVKASERAEVKLAP